MNRVQDLLSEIDGIFGPGTDLIVSLVATLIAVNALSFNTIATQQAALKAGDQQRRQYQLDLEQVHANQMSLVDALARAYHTSSSPYELNMYSISIDSSAMPDIIVENDALLQKLNFSSHVLFDSASVVLMPSGQALIGEMGALVLQRMKLLQEIQIVGHADISGDPQSNLRLASNRALTVFSQFVSFGIDPSSTLMSISSFGPYLPIGRSVRSTNFSWQMIKERNDSDTERQLNRRIEIILVYRLNGDDLPQIERPGGELSNSLSP